MLPPGLVTTRLCYHQAVFPPGVVITRRWYHQASLPLGFVTTRLCSEEALLCYVALCFVLRQLCVVDRKHWSPFRRRAALAAASNAEPSVAHANARTRSVVMFRENRALLIANIDHRFGGELRSPPRQMPTPHLRMRTREHEAFTRPRRKRVFFHKRLSDFQAPICL